MGCPPPPRPVADPLVPEVRQCLLDERASALFRQVLLDPTVIKLLHGCANDVVWLATNFDLYLSGVLDTQDLAKAAGCSSRALAVLLKRTFEVHTDKSYQTSDWRSRPLSAPARQYARIDTRYLAPLAHRLLLRLCPAEGDGFSGSGVQSLCSVVDSSHSTAVSCLEREVSTDFSDARWLRTWTRWLHRAAAEAALSPAAGTAAAPGPAGDAAATAALKGLYPVPSEPVVALNACRKHAFLALAACQARHAMAVMLDMRGEAVCRSTVLLRCVLGLSNTPTALSCVDSIRAHLLEVGLMKGLFPSGPPAASCGQVRDAPPLSTGVAGIVARGIARCSDAAGALEVFAQCLEAASRTAQGPKAAHALDMVAAAWWVESHPDSTLTPGSLQEVLSASVATTSQAASSGSVAAQREAQKAARWGHIAKKYSRRHLYDSCELRDHDGTPLAFIERRRADWYVRKGLAKLVDNGAGKSAPAGTKGSVPTVPEALPAGAEGNRVVVQLLRAARGGGATRTNNVAKVNMCVRCGGDHLMSKFYIVPRKIRSLMPMDAKSHSCHDVVLLCANCRRLVEPMYTRLEKRLAREAGLPDANYLVHGPSGMLLADLGIQPLAGMGRIKAKKHSSGKKAKQRAEEGREPSMGAPAGSVREQLAQLLLDSCQAGEGARAHLAQARSSESFTLVCSVGIWSHLPPIFRKLLWACTAACSLDHDAELAALAAAAGYDSPTSLLQGIAACGYRRIQGVFKVLSQASDATSAQAVTMGVLLLSTFLARLAVQVPVVLDGGLPQLPRMLEEAAALLLHPRPDTQADLGSQPAAWRAELEEWRGSETFSAARQVHSTSKTQERFLSTLTTRWRDAVANYCATITVDPSPESWLPQLGPGGAQHTPRALVRPSGLKGDDEVVQPTHSGMPVLSARATFCLMSAGATTQSLAKAVSEAGQGGTAEVAAAVGQVLSATQAVPASLAASNAAADQTPAEQLEAHLKQQVLFVPQAVVLTHFSLYPRAAQVAVAEARAKDLAAAPCPPALQGLKDQGVTLSSGQSAAEVALALASAPPLPGDGTVLYVPSNHNRPWVPPATPPVEVKERLERLVRRFRDFFMNSVQPQFMPDGWHVGLEVFLPGGHKHHRFPPQTGAVVHIPEVVAAATQAAGLQACMPSSSAVDEPGGGAAAADSA